ncbi:hypothetical protein [Cerasicoccus arenae]|uniref:hypothetical protein n=1 Tax=Cerasicoccus arenae TaxID=424488 RepID=UPI001904E6B7|nr:hypothetical protein [Cerasicoccus arenae]MBK1858493.1 hypothetical protein [Cerasicoccus arenae]
MNDTVSLYGFYFCLPGLLTLLPALHVPPRWGIPLCLATALFYAAPYSEKIAPFLVVYGLGYVIFRQFSSQLRRFRRFQLLTALAAANTLLILIQSALLSPEVGILPYMQRVMVDAMLSAILIYPVGSWFIDLQYGAMQLFGTDPRADAPPQ